jgi:hypothetical protein
VWGRSCVGYWVSGSGYAHLIPTRSSRPYLALNAPPRGVQIRSCTRGSGRNPPSNLTNGLHDLEISQDSDLCIQHQRKTLNSTLSPGAGLSGRGVHTDSSTTHMAPTTRQRSLAKKKDENAVARCHTRNRHWARTEAHFCSVRPLSGHRQTYQLREADPLGQRVTP